MNDQQKKPTVRAFVVTIESRTGATFTQLVGADTCSLHDVLQRLQKQIRDFEDKAPTLWKEPLLEGDPDTGDGRVVVTSPKLVVAVNTAFEVEDVLDAEDDDGEEDEDEDYDDEPDDLQSKTKQSPHKTTKFTLPVSE